MDISPKSACSVCVCVRVRVCMCMRVRSEAQGDQKKGKECERALHVWGVVGHVYECKGVILWGLALLCSPGDGMARLGCQCRRHPWC